MKLAFLSLLALPAVCWAQSTQSVAAAPAAVLGAADAAQAAVAAPAPAVPEIPSPGMPPVSSLPLVVPGYELRELDVKKPVVFKVGAKVVEAKMPVFVYFPIELAARTEAIKELRALYDNVVKLAGKTSPTPGDFRSILVSLDSALTQLEAYPALQPNVEPAAPAK